MEEYDVVIAGAGIAGCHAARDLARLGHSVLILEKRTREELGHDWWDTIRRSTFPEVGLPMPEPPELMGPVGPAKVYSPLGTGHIDLPARPALISIDRRLFARRQLEYAEKAGAIAVFQTSVTGPIIEEGAVRGVTIFMEEGEQEELRSRIVMDASGYGATLRAGMPEEFGFPKNVRRRDTFITHREIRENTTDSREAVFVFGENNGLRWTNLEHEGLADFFAGFIDLPDRPDPKEVVKEMIGNDGRAGDAVLRGGYGAPIPIRHCFDSFVAPGFVLCGDAACQCNPLDGSGMASSLKAASIAARVIHAACEQDRVDLPALWPYNVEYKRTQGAKFVTMDALQKFMVSEQKKNIEILFRRGIIDMNGFWDTGELKGGSTTELLVTLLKLVDRPRFIGRLASTMSTVENLASHFKDYPEKYDRGAFEAWRKRKSKLFRRISGRY